MLRYCLSIILQLVVAFLVIYLSFTPSIFFLWFLWFIHLFLTIPYLFHLFLLLISFFVTTIFVSVFLFLLPCLEPTSWEYLPLQRTSLISLIVFIIDLQFYIFVHYFHLPIYLFSCLIIFSLLKFPYFLVTILQSWLYFHYWQEKDHPVFLWDLYLLFILRSVFSFIVVTIH